MRDAAGAVFECRFRSTAVLVRRRIGAGGEATVWEGCVTRGGRRHDAAIRFVHADLLPEKLDELVALAARGPTAAVRLASDARLTAQAVRHAQLLQFVAQASLPRRLPGLAGFLDYGLMRVRMPDGAWESCGFLATRLVRAMGRGDARHPARNARAAVRCALEICGVLRALTTRRGARRLVTHGDLTPSNVLVDRRGRAMLIDFGAAELAAGERPPSQSRVDGKSGASPRATMDASSWSRGASSRLELPRPAAQWLPPERSGMLRTLDPEHERHFRPAWDVYGVGTLLAEWLLPEEARAELRHASRASADGQSRSAVMHLDALLARIVRALGDGKARSWPQAQRSRMAELLGELLLSEPAQRPTLSETERRLRALVHAARADRGVAPASLAERPRPPLVWNDCHAALDRARQCVRAFVAELCFAEMHGGLRELHDAGEVWRLARTAACERGLDPARILRHCSRASADHRGAPASLPRRRSEAYAAAVEFGVALFAARSKTRLTSAVDPWIGQGLQLLAAPRKDGGAHRRYLRLEALLQWQLQSQGGVDAPAESSGDVLAVLLSNALSVARTRATKRRGPAARRAR